MTLGQMVDHVERQTTRTWANPSWWNLLVVPPWTIGTIFLIHEWKVDRDVATREQTTRGVITTHEPANHNRYGYVFWVNGKSFTGYESPRRDKLEIGKQVLVFYDPLNPSKNAITDFRELGMESLGPIPLTLFGLALFSEQIKNRSSSKLRMFFARIDCSFCKQRVNLLVYINQRGRRSLVLLFAEAACRSAVRFFSPTRPVRVLRVPTRDVDRVRRAGWALRRRSRSRTSSSR